MAINEKSQEIEAFKLTDLGFQDCEGFPILINDINKKIDCVIGDGAYDRYDGYKLSHEKKFRLIAPPRKDAKLTNECKSQTTIRQHTDQVLEALKSRNTFIERIREVGQKQWKKEINYHRRSLVETAMFRIKTILGNRLRTKIMLHQQTEIAIWCNVINKMTALGFGTD